MPYELLASSKTPALIIYVLDVSASMDSMMGGKRRIDVVTEAIGASLRAMVFRSTKGSNISPRYRIGMLAYSDHVYDLLDGIRGVDEVARLGVPELSGIRSTDTARAFGVVERILKEELPRMSDCPAPVICHMTDGEFTGDDPEPVAARIMSMTVPDGNVLVENIYISDRVGVLHDGPVSEWGGIRRTGRLGSAYAEKLRRMSSDLPDSYRELLIENGYRIDPGAVMLLPGTNSDLVAMGFQMSASTPIR